MTVTSAGSALRDLVQSSRDVYELGKTLVDYLQVTSFVFLARFEWPDTFVSRLLPYIALDISFAVKFWLYFALLWFLLIFGGLATSTDILPLPESVTAPIVWLLADNMITGVLFIPLVTTLFQVFDCTLLSNGSLVMDVDLENGAASPTLCWQGVHIAYVVFACLFFVVVGALAVVKANMQNDAAKWEREGLQAPREGISFFESKQLGYKILLIVASVFFTTYATGLAVFFFVTSFFPTLYILGALPYHRVEVNPLMGAKHLGNTWNFICALVTVTSGGSLAGTYMLLGSPVLMALGFLAVMLRMKVFPLPEPLLPPTEKYWKVALEQESILEANVDEAEGRAEFKVIGDDGLDRVLEKLTAEDAPPLKLRHLVINGVKEPPKANDADRYVSEAGCERLGAYLKSCCPDLQTLTMTGHRMKEAQKGWAIALALQHHPTLQTLSLWGNELPRDTCRSIIILLAENRTLTSLNLGNNMGDAGLREEAPALVSSRRLDAIDLQVQV